MMDFSNQYLTLGRSTDKNTFPRRQAEIPGIATVLILIMMASCMHVSHMM